MSEQSPSTLRPDSSPDALDRPLQLIKTPVIVSTVGLLLIVALTALWGAFGSINTSVTGTGAYSLGSPFIQLESTVDGQVTDLQVKSEQAVKAGAPLLTIMPLTEGARPVTITAPVDGTVRNVFVLEGEVVTPGAPTLSLVQSGNTPIVQLAVPIESAVSIEPGQSVLITPLGVVSGSYGMLRGTVRSRANLPMSQEAINTTLGVVDEQPAGQGPWVQVIVDIEKDPNSSSGLDWTTPAGDQVVLTPGQSVSAEIIVDSSSLFQRLIGE